MSQVILNIINSIGIVVIAVLLVLARCVDEQHSGVANTIEKQTIKIYDSTKKVIIPEVPATLTSYCIVPMPVNVDTAEILKRFFAVHTYSQTFADSNIVANILDTICQNKISGRSFSYKWIKPLRIVESTSITIEAKPKSRLLLGFFVDGNAFNYGIGPKLSFQTKKNFQVGYDYDAIRKIHRVNLQQQLRW